MSAPGTKHAPSSEHSKPCKPADSRQPSLSVKLRPDGRPDSERSRTRKDDPRRKFGLFAIPARSGPPAALDDHLDAASAVTTAEVAPNIAEIYVEDDGVVAQRHLAVWQPKGHQVLLANLSAIDALMLEQIDERVVCRRYMPLEKIVAINHNAFIVLPGVIA